MVFSFPLTYSSDYFGFGFMTKKPAYPLLSTPGVKRDVIFDVAQLFKKRIVN